MEYGFLHFSRRQLVIIATVSLLLARNVPIYVKIMPLGQLHEVRLEQLVRWIHDGSLHEFAARLNESHSVAHDSDL